jgi:hypothetical protein
VVVADGVLEAVYDLRTSEEIDPPTGVPLTVDQMFDAVANADPELTWFHPVLGYPGSVGHVSFSEVSEGTDFDRSLLGSTADATAAVEAVAEFTPGQAFGAAHVRGGEPIPPVQPLDEDAEQALDALAVVEEEGGYFTSTFEYGISERTDGTLVLLGEDGSGGFSDASFVREDGQWKPVGWGTCYWDDDGYGISPWVLDPEKSFEPDSRGVHLVVGDECGSHTRYGNEYLVVARTTDTEVEIEVWEADFPPPPPKGAEFFEPSCSLGEVVQLTVVLDEPIGERRLTGATDPADWPENP